MGLGVVFAGMLDEKYSDFIMNLSIFVGALLCVFVIKKQFSISIKDSLKKTELKETVLIISMALAYTAITAFTEYRDILDKPSDYRNSLTDWIGSAFLAPVSEEIIFRFSMLTLLLMSAGRGRKIVSFILVSIMWTVIHFGGDLPRFIDIFIIGMILGIIFSKSGNIIYCMIFHSIANVAIYIVSCYSDFIADQMWLLYLNIPLFIACMVILIYMFENRKNSKGMIFYGS